MRVRLLALPIGNEGEHRASRRGRPGARSGPATITASRGSGILEPAWGRGSAAIKAGIRDRRNRRGSVAWQGCRCQSPARPRPPHPSYRPIGAAGWVGAPGSRSWRLSRRQSRSGSPSSRRAARRSPRSGAPTSGRLRRTSSRRRSRTCGRHRQPRRSSISRSCRHSSRSRRPARRRGETGPGSAPG